MVSAQSNRLSSAQAAEMVGGSLEGEVPEFITGIANIASAKSSDIAFVRSEPDLGGRTIVPSPKAIAESEAGIFLLTPDFPSEGRPCLRVSDPMLAVVVLSAHFENRPKRLPGIHPAAHIEGSANINPSASVGPNVVVGDGAAVEAGVILESGVIVGEGSAIGPDCHLHAGVVLYPNVTLGKGCTIHAGSVLGSDGFGFHWDGEGHRKIAHLGGLVIGDHVDIGAGCTIDRGTFNATVIGEGCILDNQEQVGHNCILGRWVVLCGQVGLGGSTEVEDGAVFGGKSGSGGHVRIGAGAKVAGGSAVLSDVAAGEIVGGHPATDFHLDQRGKALLRRMARKKETASR